MIDNVDEVLFAPIKERLGVEARLTLTADPGICC